VAKQTYANAQRDSGRKDRAQERGANRAQERKNEAQGSTATGTLCASQHTPSNTCALVPTVAKQTLDHVRLVRRQEGKTPRQPPGQKHAASQAQGTSQRRGGKRQEATQQPRDSAPPTTRRAAQQRSGQQTRGQERHKAKHMGQGTWRAASASCSSSAQSPGPANKEGAPHDRTALNRWSRSKL